MNPIKKSSSEHDFCANQLVSVEHAWIFIKKEEQLSSKLVRPPIGSKTGSTYRYLWPVIRERVAFAPAQRPPPLRFKAYRF